MMAVERTDTGARLRQELRGIATPLTALSESLGKTCGQLAAMNRARGGDAPPQPATLDQLSDAVVVSDQQGRIIRSNLTAKALHPLLTEGCNVNQVLPHALHADPKPVEWEKRAPSGGVTYYDYVTSAAVEAGLPMFVTIFRDVTSERIISRLNATRGSLFGALAGAADVLLRADDLADKRRNYIHTLLTTYLTNSHADHAYVIKRMSQANDLCGTTYEAASTLAGSQVLSTWNLDREFPNAAARLAANLPAEIRQHHMTPEVRSNFPRACAMLLVPVYAGNLWWGELLLVFNQRPEPSWWQAEFDSARLVASLTGTVIYRAQAQRHSETHLQFQQVLFDVSPQPLYVLDIAGCFSFVNPAFCKATGLEARHILGKKPGDYFRSSNAPARREGNSIRLDDVTFLAATPRKGKLLSTSLKDAKGVAYGGIGVFSEGKDFDDSLIEKDETIALLTSLLDQSPDFYLYKNNRGECVFANAAFRQIAGCGAECLKGKTITELACYIPGKELERLNAAEFRVATGQADALTFDAEFSGKLYAVEVSRSCDPAGNPLGLLVKGTAK